MTAADGGGGGFVTAWFTHYIPDTITVDHGATPQFFNPDLYGGPFGGKKHTITEVRDRSDPGPPRFDVTVAWGQAAPIAGVEKLDSGTYHFICRVHPFMKGTLVVK
ncbi:MAG TPA: hypothetical protein VJ456_01665 [Acidimicrobiia bacterium]|nr:hypothetical protein [Acidimicrobiia bacterium]